jgi:CBS domain-containing protein
MIASKIISQIISPLRTSDTGEEALTIMNVYQVKHLPIVNNESFLGIISEDDILDNDMNEPIGSYRLSLINPFVFESDHVFDVMKKIAQGGLTTIPVIDDEENYIGLITLEDVIKFYANSFSFNESGGIIVIKVHRNNYSMAEIARIVESSNALVINSFITNSSDSNELLVSLKLNTNDLVPVKGSFHRFDYTVHSSYTETEEFDNLKERYDSFMKYLSI